MSNHSLSVEEYGDTPMRSFPWYAKCVFWFCIWAVAIFSKIYWHWTVDGKKEEWRHTESEKGRVLISNHASMLDPAILLIDTSVHRRRIRPLFKSELEGSKLFSKFFAFVGGIPIKRGTADTKAIRRAVNAIKRGEDVLIFPEGTRIREYNGYPEIHGGFSVIAQMAQADIVPVAIEGTHKICPKGHGFCHPTRVYVRYGDPIDLSKVSGANRKEVMANVEKYAMDQVYEMRNDIRAEIGRVPIVYEKSGESCL